MIVRTRRPPDPRPHGPRASAVAVLLLCAATCGFGCRPAVRAVPGTEGSQRSFRIVSVSPHESRLIVMDVSEDGELRAICAVDLATGRRTDFNLASLPPGTATQYMLADLHPETDQATYITWFGERFAMSLAPKRPYLVIDGNQMTAVPAWVDLFGHPPTLKDYLAQIPEERGYDVITYPNGAQYHRMVPGRGLSDGNPDVPRRHAADSALAAQPPRVYYTYDPRLGAIVAQRDSGRRRVVLRMSLDASGDGTPGEISLSPNGRYLAYVESRHRGFGVRHDLFLANVATGRRRRIAELYSAECVPWSRDSRHVYFANANDEPPMRVRVIDVERLFGRR